MSNLPEDEQVRGRVYLCQTGACVSCGSCCGLYNMADLSRERLHAILSARTDSFATVPRNIDGILAFEKQRLRIEGDHAPTRDFHHCVFVGLIRDEGERVGCLLHPLALNNRGIDWRGLSFYGGAACKFFFCPSYDELDAGIKRLAREVLDDWYEYGLIIPEHRFLTAILDAVESRLGFLPDADDISEDGKKVLADLMRLKLNWPFRDETTPLAWNFFSTKNTSRPALLTDVGAHDPQLLGIMHELDTLPEHAARAEKSLREHLEKAVKALRPK
jgi:hypothetical protein